MTNAERIVRELDRHLDHAVRLVLYGRAAIALGFPDAPSPVRLSLNVDVIIPSQEIETFQADTRFWAAQDAVNRKLQGEGLYITHLFTANEVFLRPDWERHVASIDLPNLRWLCLARPATIDLVLTKMMRGADPTDTADLEFLIRHDRIPPAELEDALASAVIPDIPELRELFEQAKPVVRSLAQRISQE